MNGDEKKEILEAISELKTEIAVLRTKQENTENYVFKELKIDIEAVCDKVEMCLEKAEKGYMTNLRWMTATIVTGLLGVFGWIGWFLQ